MDTPQKNITRALEALSPYLNDPRRTVIWIEAFVALAAALFFLQFILGGCRRRSGHWFIQGGLWLCYTSSFPLITYTIGQMVSSPVKNGLYPLWATLLFWAAGCTNSVTAYALEDNKQWKRYLFELFQYYNYSGIIFRLINASSGEKIGDVQPVTIPLVFLIGVLFVTNHFRVIAGWMVTNSSSSRVVADYMKAADLKGDQGTLEGCRYLVWFYVTPAIGKGPTYRTKLRTHHIVTVNTIWEAEEFNDIKNGSGSRLKDVCLSFALSELLKRRFYEMECAEANLPETRDFVLKSLLKQDKANKDYTRAFQIIEVELGFLYDFFFTKYAVFSQTGVCLVILMAAFKLMLISMCGAFVLRGSFTIKILKPVIEVGTTTVDATITVVMIGAVCLVEVLQVILYVASDWATVSLACSCTRSGTRYRKVILFIISCLGRFNLSLSRTKFGEFLDRHNLFGYWQNKMGQSSVIEGCLHVGWEPIDHHNTFSINLWLKQNLVDLWLSVGYSRKTFLVVPDLVKSEIVFVLEEHCKRGGPLTNGVAALDRDANFSEFAWTLSNHHSQTMAMLMWHIATEYCNIASSNQEADPRTDPHRYVATTLSRYCAYLMSFVPDLLPGNSTDTKFVNYAVLLEAKKFLSGRGTITKDILMSLITIDSVDFDNVDTGSSMFIKGLELGRALENKGADHWKVLAEFWAETIIFIAPSDNAAAHMERLAQGGEFLTHIWALLNHAGILNREQHLAPQDDVV